MENEKKTKKILVWVEPTLLIRFDEACKLDQRDRSSGLRAAMTDYIKKVGDKNK